MMPRNRRSLEDLSIAVLVTMETPNFFSGLLPSRMTIARFASEPRDRAQLRRAEFKATLYALGLGAAASYLSESILPLVGTAIMSGLLVATDYEPAIRDAMVNPDATPIDQQNGDYPKATAGAGPIAHTPRKWSFAGSRGSYIDSGM